jgi:hypothetical protein
MIVSVNWQYIILKWPSNGVYRVKKRTDGPPPVPDTGVDVVNNDFWTRTAPPDLIYNNDRYDFAFWSITGQDMLSPQREAHLDGKTASSSHPGTVAAGGGMWIVTAKAYYVRDVGIGGGPNGLFIDAFDIQAGDFIADDFTDVTPDNAAKTLTAEANDGYINTDADIVAGTSIKITARDILPSGKQFSNWQEVSSLLTSGNPATPAMVGAPGIHDIVAHTGDNIYAFAFYNELPPTLRPPFRHYEIFDPAWWIETRGGLVAPGPPPPWLTEYAVALSLANSASGVSPSLRSAVLQIALKQLSIAATNIKGQIKNQGK